MKTVKFIIADYNWYSKANDKILHSVTSSVYTTGHNTFIIDMNNKMYFSVFNQTNDILVKEIHDMNIKNKFNGNR